MERDPDCSGVLVTEGVLDTIGEQFVDDEAAGHGGIDYHLHIFQIELEIDLLSGDIETGE